MESFIQHELRANDSLVVLNGITNKRMWWNKEHNTWMVTGRDEHEKKVVYCETGYQHVAIEELNK